MHVPHRHQIEIGVALASTSLLLLLTPLGGQVGVWPAALAVACGVLLVAQPPALVGLIEHFRPVPTEAKWAVMGGSALGLLAHAFWPFPRPAALLVVTAACFAVVQGGAAWMLIEEARRRQGFTRLRLALAGAGTALAALLVVVEGVGWWFGARLPLTAQVALMLAVIGGYWLGFAPPRRLRHSRQQAEITRFLRQTADRAQDERTDYLADDLHGAAVRGVMASSTAVLFGRDELTVCATSEPAWQELRMAPDMGLVGIAMGGTDPVVGPREECERPLNELAQGDVVAVVPITRGSHRWGAVLLVERRASLFEADDLAFVSELCRHAADVLDYARLRHEERSQRPRLADLRLSV